jgi:hypothetical protein
MYFVMVTIEHGCRSTQNVKYSLPIAAIVSVKDNIFNFCKKYKPLHSVASS